MLKQLKIDYWMKYVITKRSPGGSRVYVQSVRGHKRATRALSRLAMQDRTTSYYLGLA